MQNTPSFQAYMSAEYDRMFKLATENSLDGPAHMVLPEEAGDVALSQALWDAEYCQPDGSYTEMPVARQFEYIDRARTVRHWLNHYGHEVCRYLDIQMPPARFYRIPAAGFIGVAIGLSLALIVAIGVVAVTLFTKII